MSDGETIKMLASPLKIPTQPTTMRMPPPTLGEHSGEILAEVLGYDAARIQDLRASKII
jgi:crotonobetainyl-CoA:carnitine CoA-transferase CaiB-like acyl-CoA transferase